MEQKPCPRCGGEGEWQDFGDKDLSWEYCSLCNGTGDCPEEVWTLDLNFQGDHQYEFYASKAEAERAISHNAYRPGVARACCSIIPPGGIQL